MATETLPPQEAGGQLFHQLGSKGLSTSPPSLFLAGSTATLSSTSKSPPPSPPSEHIEKVSSLPASSLDSSPRPTSIDLSNISPFNASLSTSSFTPSSFSLDDKADDDIDLPNYGNSAISHHDEGYESQRTGADESDVPDFSITTGTSRSDSPLATPVVADDTMIKQEPSRHVDYLSHDWREEDIWASWRHIVSQRSVYGQRSRLENASWRTWAKSKYRLRTVSPERLNWLKESDVTWLYGPLKPAESHPITSDTSQRSSSQISKSSSFINKKPILKKRSVSEVMLQKSLSNSSLVKQAAAAVQAQERKHSHRRMNRIVSDLFPSSPSASISPSRDEFDYFSSRTSTNSGGTPSAGQTQKQLRFDEKVDQCIAVDCKERIDEESESEVEDDPPNSALTESDSDEGLFMMDKGKRHGPKKEGKVSRSNSTSSQMIETLPSTTLKYRTDSPDVDPEAQQHHVFGTGWGKAKLSPSPSQETLRPSRPSRNFLLADDDEDGELDTSSSWSFGRNNPKSSLGASASSQPSSSMMMSDDFNPTDGYDGIEGMRRTESGMFMPYDEDEDDAVAEGLFGRVSETINTFRDISHVLWNVGWRR